MKKMLLIALLAANQIFAQELPIDPETKRVSFTEVVDVPGKSQADLYSSIKSWGATFFRSSKSTLDLDDKEAGKLVYKGNLSAKPIKAVIGTVDAGFFNFAMSVWVKEGKYKVEVTSFNHVKIPSNANDKNVISCGDIENEKCGNGMTSLPSKKHWNAMKEELALEIQNTFASLKKVVQKNEKDF